MLKDYPPFQANDFEYLRGRILILLPENDIFKKEDQKRFADLFRKLDAEIRTVPGGHVGFIVQAERYLDLMETFLLSAAALPRHHHPTGSGCDFAGNAETNGMVRRRP